MLTYVTYTHQTIHISVLHVEIVIFVIIYNFLFVERKKAKNAVYVKNIEKPL